MRSCECIFRQVSKWGNSPCLFGFRFPSVKALRLKAGDQIAVRVEGERELWWNAKRRVKN